MSTGGDEQRGARPSAEWTASIDGPVTSTALHDRANAVVVGVGEESPAGPAVAVFAADDGTRRGRVTLDGRLSGSYYHPDPACLFVRTDADRVYAVDPGTGELAWEAQASGVGPTVDGTTFLYGGANLWAYRARDGARQWQTTLPDDILSPSIGVDAITPLGDRLVVGAGKYDDMGLVGVHPNTGDEAWYYRPGDAEYVFVDAGRLYVGIDGNERKFEFVRVNTSTGAPEWTHTNSSLSGSGIYPSGSVIYLRESQSGVIAAVDAETGRERWRWEEYWYNGGLWVGDEEVCASMQSAGRDQFFVSLDPETGRTAWETEMDGRVESIADIRNGHVYAGTRAFIGDGGTAYRLNAATGRIRWTSELGESVRSIYADADPVLVKTGNDSLYGVDRSSGRIAWSFADGGLTVPYAGDRYVLALGGETYCVLSRVDGAVTWRLGQDEYGVVARDDLLIVEDGETLSVHPLAETPAAFDGETDVYEHDDRAEEDTSTEVYTSDDGTDGDTHTEVYTSDDTGDAPAFCPTCGTDLGEYDAVNFCPTCGTDL